MKTSGTVTCLLLVAVALSACSTTGDGKQPVKDMAAESKRPLFEPETFHLSGTLSTNLPPQLCAQTGLPTTIKGAFEVDASSEAISAAPLRSHHSGHVKLVLTDGSGKQALADVNIQVSGDSKGSPTEGLAQLITRFRDVASLMVRPISEPTTSAP